jgi:hypothetical protein
MQGLDDNGNKFINYIETILNVTEKEMTLKAKQERICLPIFLS